MTTEQDNEEAWADYRKVRDAIAAGAILITREELLIEINDAYYSSFGHGQFDEKVQSMLDHLFASHEKGGE